MKLFVLVQKPSPPRPAGRSVVAAAVHVRQLLEAGSPVIQVVIVLVPAATGGVERAQGAGRGAAALVVEDQERVIGWSCGVVVSSFKALGWERQEGITGGFRLPEHKVTPSALEGSQFAQRFSLARSQQFQHTRKKKKWVEGG